MKATLLDWVEQTPQDIILRIKERWFFLIQVQPETDGKYN